MLFFLAPALTGSATPFDTAGRACLWLAGLATGPTHSQPHSGASESWAGPLPLASLTGA